MVYSENAKIIQAQELVEMINEEVSNPTIERMMFIETKKNDKFPGKVFPCYFEAYEKEIGEAPKKDEYAFQLCVMQCMGEEFGLIRVVVRESELGITKRIWDKPPTKGLREEHPFLQEVTQ